MTFSAMPVQWKFFMTLLLAGLMGAGCQTLQVEQPAPVHPADWRTEGQSPARQQRAVSQLAPPLVEAWSYDADAGFSAGSPLITRDVVYIATRQGEVHAVRLEDGERLGSDEFGAAIEGTPVLQDGLLYVPIAWGNRPVVAHDLAQAETRWKAEGAPVEAGLLLLDDNVVAADVEGAVTAYDAQDGSAKWTHQPGDTATVYAAPVAPDARSIFVADAEGRLRMLSAGDGAVRWQRTLDSPVYVTPAAHDSTLFVSTTRGRFYALDAETGATRWRYAVKDSTVRFAAPAVNGELVLFGGSDGQLRALDRASGAVRWTFDAEEPLTAAPLLAENTVYIGGMSQMLYALDLADGTLTWKQELEGRVKSAMAARGNHLVVLAEPQHVYLFEPDSSTDYASSD